VAVTPAWLQVLGKQGRAHRVAGGGGQGFGVQVQGSQVEGAALVGPVQGEQPGLEGDEGDGVIGLEAGAGAVPAVGIETAGDVQGQTQAAGGGQLCDPIAVQAFDGPLQADAEQRVDDHGPAPLGRCWQAWVGSAAEGQPGSMGGGGIGGQAGRVGGKGDADPVARGVQAPGHHKAVAPVVARPAGHQHQGAGAGQQIQGHGRRGSPGPFHQGRYGTGQGQALDGAEGCDGVDGGRRHVCVELRCSPIVRKPFPAGREIHSRSR
jgi:hypothetical protein